MVFTSPFSKISWSFFASSCGLLRRLLPRGARGTEAAINAFDRAQRKSGCGLFEHASCRVGRSMARRNIRHRAAAITHGVVMGLDVGIETRGIRLASSGRLRVARLTILCA